MNHQKIVYTYTDGSGNMFAITNAERITIEYHPIKPLYSSSGIYDGGEPLNKEVSISAYESIITLLNDAIDDKKNHLKNRIKTSSIIGLEKEDFKEYYIISHNSDALTPIGDWFLAFRGIID